MSHKIAVIVTWFGPLPVYFDAWLKSAEYNKDIDFLCFFDHEFEPGSPNIRLIKTTMENEIKRISEKTGEKINIKNSYKFCDLRPSFGKGYEDFLKGYDFWAYCDIDLVFGNIRHFLTDEVLDSYDRFYYYGHLSVYRNNDMFRNPYALSGCVYSNDEIFRKPAKCTPEEYCGLNRICRINNIPWYTKDDFADFYVQYGSLQLNKYQNYEKQAFFWEKGYVYRVYEDDGRLKTNEFVYLHWQKRKPVIEKGALDKDSFYITGTRIFSKEPEKLPTVEEICSINPPLSDEERKTADKNYIKKKLKDFMKSSFGQKKIWLRQKYYFKKENGKLIDSKM